MGDACDCNPTAPYVPTLPSDCSRHQSKTSKTTFAHDKPQTLAACQKDAERTSADGKGKYECLAKGDADLEEKRSKYGQIYKDGYPIRSKSAEGHYCTSQRNDGVDYRRRLGSSNYYCHHLLGSDCRRKVDWKLVRN